MKTLDGILNQRNLSALFQPVMDLSTGTFIGFEGLIRCPADSPLYSPADLFAAAKQQGLWANAESFHSHHEIAEAAAAAKQMAKNKPGNSLFIERRELPQPESANFHTFPSAYHG